MILAVSVGWAGTESSTRKPVNTKPGELCFEDLQTSEEALCSTGRGRMRGRRPGHSPLAILALKLSPTSQKEVSCLSRKTHEGEDVGKKPCCSAARTSLPFLRLVSLSTEGGRDTWDYVASLSLGHLSSQAAGPANQSAQYTSLAHFQNKTKFWSREASAINNHQGN